MIYEEITRTIIGCAMYVHTTLGRGYPEIIYQRALAIEMELAGLNFDREKQIDIIFRDVLIGTRQVDFIVNGEVLVELKATSELDDHHYVQVFNYLEMNRKRLALLFNFGATRLEFKRIYNKHTYPDETSESNLDGLDDHDGLF